MKIRVGYVTNSSSTNFLILSKKELTTEYLFEKLGFEKNSIIRSYALELCENILEGTENGLRYYDFDVINYENIKTVFGEQTARKYIEYKNKGFKSYVGYTGNDDVLTNFFTTDTFELEEKDIYINGRSFTW